jgi:gamma-glutamyl:cysteine ligase YbdK (ATP-grasp superfamily)
VVPDYLETVTDYRRLLARLYQALGDVDGGSRLRHEWVNSRGAILRFSRRAIEIRVLDMQECVAADAAVAAFVRGALREIVERLGTHRIELPPHAVLVSDFQVVARDGTRARVAAPHLRPVGSEGDDVLARDVLLELLGPAEARTPDADRPYLSRVEDRLREGNLAERIRRRLGWPDDPDPAEVRAVYEELADCLVSNTPWPG